MPNRTDSRKTSKKRIVLRLAVVLGLLYGALTLGVASILPQFLLNAWTPPRTDKDRRELLEKLRAPDSFWTEHRVAGGEGASLELHWLHRPCSRGVAIHLHGAFDDAWAGTALRFFDLPGWDGLIFTFRGRDRRPEIPCTLGGWERFDVTAVVAFLESRGVGRDRILLVGNSMGAGIALLALGELERGGPPLAGALLESPFRDISDAANNHIANFIGPCAVLLRPAVALALRKVGRSARFDPGDVSPAKVAANLRTPIAVITGDADTITPLDGVRAGGFRDLTVVAGAGHMFAGGKFPGGWKAWAALKLGRWGLASEELRVKSEE